MTETIVRWRNKIIHILYKGVLKPIFFRYDPEFIHDRMLGFGRRLGRYAVLRKMTAYFFDYQNTILGQKIHGIYFPNPVGLAAGFDKNAELTAIMPSVGFGFVEVGSITGYPCAGNPKPRLWRLPQSKSLAVYYGLKNYGCEIIAERLKNKKFKIPVGASVAMTNCQENLDTATAIKDYAKAFTAMEPLANYITVNISCPNARGGQPFVDSDKLERLMQKLDTIYTSKPVFIKFSPDLSTWQVDDLLEIARRHRIHGIICTNLTKKRDNPKIADKNVPEKGGLSGKVVEDLADAMLAYIYKKEGGRFVLVGCGGVFTAEDAYKKIRLGASLVQLITGMIFEGPQVISEINQGLARLLRRDGFRTIRDAIGVDN